MSTLVFCVFDLTHATREDYLYAYMDLATLGLRKRVKSENGPSFRLPANGRDGHGGRSERRGRAQHHRQEGAGLVQNARLVVRTFFVVASADWACAGELT